MYFAINEAQHSMVSRKIPCCCDGPNTTADQLSNRISVKRFHFPVIKRLQLLKLKLNQLSAATSRTAGKQHGLWKFRRIWPRQLWNNQPDRPCEET